MPNSKAQNFSKGRRKTFMEVNKEITQKPGPGSYNDGNTISDNAKRGGTFILTDTKNCKASDFGRYSDRFEEFYSKDQLERMDYHGIDMTTKKG